MSELAQAALVSGVFAVIVIVVQAAVARMNSAQHGMVDEKIDGLVRDVRGVVEDVRGVKDDVRDMDHKVDTLRSEDTRRHEENLVHLERHDESLASIDKHIALVDQQVTDLTERLDAHDNNPEGTPS